MNPHSSNVVPFPTMAEVEAADHLKLADWYRFLVLPANDRELAIVNRMMERFHAAGGWTDAVREHVAGERAGPTTPSRPRRRK